MTQKSFKKNNPALSFITSAQEEVEAPAQETAPQIKETSKPEGYKLNPEYIETKSKRVQLLLQPSVVESMKDLARKKGLSLNEAVNEAIKDYLKNN